MSESADWWCRWFRLTDRFGDHGLIGVILARREKPNWMIDTWLMSCRVLGRNMEKFMAQVLLKAAESENAGAVIGEYIAAPKNALVKDFYQQIGFKALPDQLGKFVFNLDGENPPPDCAYIQDQSL
jgi:FkbH-like protein